MAQHDTNVALIILTTQMWGGGLLVEKTFSGQNLAPTSVLTQNKGPDTELHFSNPPPLLRRASMSAPPPPPRRAIFRSPCVEERATPAPPCSPVARSSLSCERSVILQRTTQRTLVSHPTNHTLTGNRIVAQANVVQACCFQLLCEWDSDVQAPRPLHFHRTANGRMWARRCTGPRHRPTALPAERRTRRRGWLRPSTATLTSTQMEWCAGFLELISPVQPHSTLL